ncbi:hypothetical protein [Geotoga petraea]|uniref:Uncharacterized protein n=1 Tax=Geotoga petraea TaxID=28234 RepID=A0A4Z0VU25_9BACT|nr:hypothetical protein [Geotoga petraea]TGG87459.1 hypothetical protein E4650_06830 [Geotoga petraea]
MKNLVFVILIILLGVLTFTNEIAILTTKNGKMLEDYSILEEDAYSLTFYNIFNEMKKENVINLFFSQPDYLYDSIVSLIELEIKKKYISDKGLTIDSTNVSDIQNIDKKDIKNNVSEILGRKIKLEEMLRNQLKIENDFEDFIDNHRNELLEEFDVFYVEQYQITIPATPTELFFKETLASTPINHYIVYEKNDLNNFKDFKSSRLNGYTLCYNENSLFSIEEILDPNEFINYGLKDEIIKYYEDSLIKKWKDQYPNNFDFILTYKPLKIQDRIDKMEDQNLKRFLEIKNFYSDLIFGDEKIPEMWYISYFNILSDLEYCYVKKIDKLEELQSNLPEEYFEKNYSEIQKITEESTSSTLTNYLNFYKDIIYENSEINSIDSYLEFLNSYNDEYEKILHTKLEILNLIIQNDFDFFKSVIKDKFDLTEEEVLLMYYQEIYEYIKSLNIDKGSNVYSTLLEVLESLQSEKDSRIFENLIKEISEYLEMDKINENE